jgi:hypothetical protein
MSEYMDVESFIEDCMAGELTVERLVAYGNKLDEYRQRYTEGRAHNGNFDDKIELEIDGLVSYIRGGLPDRIQNGIIEAKGQTPEEALRKFVGRNISPETLSHLIDYKPAHEIKEELEALV